MSALDDWNPAKKVNTQDKIFRVNSNRSFLRRNLRKAIRLHQELNDTVQMTSQDQELKARQSWRPPSAAEIQDIRGFQTVQLEIVGIRQARARREGRNQEDGGRRHKRAALLHSAVTISTTILGRKSKEKAWRRCRSSYGESASITAETRGNRGQPASVHITPFTATADQLKIGPDRKSLAEAYKASISIHFNDLQDGQDLLKALDVPDNSRMTEHWIAHGEDILHFPDGRSMLPLFSRDERSKDTPLGVVLEVKVTCDFSSGDSILAKANNRRRPASLQTARDKLMETSVSQPTYEILFSFLWVRGKRSERQLVFPDLHCPHCDPEHQPSGLVNISDLHLHLKCLHVDFHYTVKKDSETDGVQYWTFEAQKVKGATDGVESDPDNQFVVPDRPCDIQAWLQGDTSWQADAMEFFTAARSRRPQYRPRIHGERQKYRVPAAKPGITYFRSFTKRPVAEGELLSESDDEIDMEWLRHRTEQSWLVNVDIPEKARRFRNRYDQHMRDERLSGDVGLIGALLRFVHDNWQWLQEEGLVEELRKKATELLEDEIISQRLYDACLKKIDSEEGGNSNHHSAWAQQHRLAAELVHPTPPLTPDPSTTSEGDVSGSLDSNKTGINKRLDRKKRRAQSVQAMGEDVEMTDAETSVIPPIAPGPTLASAYDRCICGQIALVHSRQQVIHCQSICCIRRLFHIECVEQHWRPKKRPKPLDKDWYCQDCEHDPDVDTGDSSLYPKAQKKQHERLGRDISMYFRGGGVS